ncbi:MULTISPECIES: hypothetical protein [Mesonia]|nr:MULTISPECIES: hypothetical protein [Mesonia]|tara:strand:- start:3571 stop:3714 length:144 start_codon:yes stop_codon:yes gene_type:complete
MLFRGKRGAEEEFLKFLMKELRPEIKEDGISSPTTFLGHFFEGRTVL